MIIYYIVVQTIIINNTIYLLIIRGFYFLFSPFFTANIWFSATHTINFFFQRREKKMSEVYGLIICTFFILLLFIKIEK